MKMDLKPRITRIMLAIGLSVRRPAGSGGRRDRRAGAGAAQRHLACGARSELLHRRRFAAAVACGCAVCDHGSRRAGSHPACRCHVQHGGKRAGVYHCNAGAGTRIEQLRTRAALLLPALVARAGWRRAGVPAAGNTERQSSRHGARERRADGRRGDRAVCLVAPRLLDGACRGGIAGAVPVCLHRGGMGGFVHGGHGDRAHR